MAKITEGKLLRDIRYKMGLTQREFAQKLGSVQQIIAMIEKGQREVPKSIIKALSNFGIDFYRSMNVGNAVKVEANRERMSEGVYTLSITAKVEDLSTVNKITELLGDVIEMSVFKVGEGYYKQEV